MRKPYAPPAISESSCASCGQENIPLHATDTPDLRSSKYPGVYKLCEVCYGTSYAEGLLYAIISGRVRECGNHDVYQAVCRATHLILAELRRKELKNDE